jgi:hypothetical protein
MSFALAPICALTWSRFGYKFDPSAEATARAGLMIAGVAGLAVGAARAWLAWRRSGGMVEAAEQIDSRVGAHEQILTLAALAVPNAGAEESTRRSPLFPLLAKRAAAFLDRFDPVREFRPRLAGPLKQSSKLAAIVAFAIVLATLGLVRPPSQFDMEAQTLRRIADEIAAASSDPDSIALADKVREAADALTNPKLPPEEKLRKLGDARDQMMKRREGASNERHETGGGPGTSKSSGSSGAGTGSGTSEANAKGSSGAGKGEGSGESGSGKNAPGKGPGSSGDKTQGPASGDKTDIELRNELDKAQAQVETAESKNPNNSGQAGTDKNRPGPTAGNNPAHKGAGENPDANGGREIPHPADKDAPKSASGAAPAGQKDQGSSMGDTHLGDFPTPQKVQRYLKPGEAGASVNVKDARYVTFKLPNAAAVGSSPGSAVLDSGRPRASTPYTNAPLAAARDDAPADERQLVPPRYRDLIR